MNVSPASDPRISKLPQYGQAIIRDQQTTIAGLERVIAELRAEIALRDRTGSRDVNTVIETENGTVGLGDDVEVTFRLDDQRDLSVCVVRGRLSIEGTSPVVVYPDYNHKIYLGWQS